MRQRLTTAQIEDACKTLLQIHRRVGVRDVTQYLLEKHGARGKTERVAVILRALIASPPILSPATPSPSPEIADLQQRLQAAELRAQRSEEIERAHQDFWARRFDERCEQIEKQYAARLASVPKPIVSSDKYLRIRQRLVELERRLAEYETVDPFIL